MASRIHNEWASIGVHVLEGYPHPAHEPGWEWCQVHHIVVNGLLTAMNEIERLARNSLVIEDRRQAASESRDDSTRSRVALLCSNIFSMR